MTVTLSTRGRVRLPELRRRDGQRMVGVTCFIARERIRNGTGGVKRNLQSVEEVTSCCSNP